MHEFTGTIDVKRFYLDGVIITCDCDKCGSILERDFGSDYLSYPTVGEPEDIEFWCEDCDHDITKTMTIKKMLLDIEVTP